MPSRGTGQGAVARKGGKKRRPGSLRQGGNLGQVSRLRHAAIDQVWPVRAQLDGREAESEAGVAGR